MRSLKLYVALGLVSLAAFAAAAFAFRPAVAVRAEASAASAQASIYRTHCSKCHGNDGRANTREGRRTEATDLTDDSVKNMSAEKMARTIKNGKGEMPGMGRKLTEAQIASLVRYVRGL